MKWKEERVEIMKKMWREGLRERKIEEKIGGVRRKEVIGKVNRMKI